MDPKKILIVENAETMLRLEKTFLTRRAFDITLARTGAEGLATARSLRPHLVLADLNLPDLDGDALCRQLKGRDETMGIVVILVSGLNEPESRKRCLGSGCDGWLSKPLNQENLCRMVEGLLGITVRVHCRVQADLNCEVVVSGVPVLSRLLDISEGGAFVSPSLPLPEAKDLNLRFSLPGKEKKMVIPSRVCWSDLEGHQGRRGLGVRFLSLNTEDLVRIRTFVALRMKDRATAKERADLMPVDFPIEEGQRTM